MKSRRCLLVITTALLLSIYAGAQIKSISTTSQDESLAKTASLTGAHVLHANTTAATAYKEASALKGPPTTPFPSGNNRYPGDLSYLGGPIVGQAQSHAIYIVFGGTICTPTNISTCWGNPEGFLQNLAGSGFIHVVDQYAQRYDSNRYTNGADAAVYFGQSVILGATLSDANMLQAIHAVIVQLGYPTGENDIYHVFIPPGVDECIVSGVCYSPDVPSTFVFCAYHSSATFSDVGHVLYSVEPYQNLPGCSSPPGGPQGQLADSTNNILSHELFETITDPEGNAMINVADNGIYGEEIGDECSFIVFPAPGVVYFNPSVFRMGGMKYAAQPEYSNIGHACRTSMED